jgi:hypothetical protein
MPRYIETYQLRPAKLIRNKVRLAQLVVRYITCVSFREPLESLT